MDEEDQDHDKGGDDWAEIYQRWEEEEWIEREREREPQYRLAAGKKNYKWKGADEKTGEALSGRSRSSGSLLAPAATRGVRAHGDEVRHPKEGVQ